MAQVSGTGRGKNLRSTSSRKAAFAVGLVVALLGGLFVVLSPSANAAGAVTPITDYANYPSGITPALVPDGCGTTGTAVLTGQHYAKNGGSPVSDLASLSLVPGDVITMTWDGFAANCSGIGVTLSAKKTQHNTFKPFTNQALVDHIYCGPLGDSCGASAPFGPLTLTVPTTQTACNFQIDATIGPPLAVVGPLGSYYSSVTRGENGKPYGTVSDADMLISAIVGGQETCFEPPTATAIASCTAASNGPGFDLSISNNDDDQNAIVDVKKGTTVVNDNLSIPFPTPPAPLPNVVHVFVPFSEGETATVTVINTVDDSVIYSGEFTANCVDAGATITHSCADGGVNVDFTNTGTESTQLTVTKGGVVIDTVTVAGGGTAHRTYPMAEDETATYRVTGGGFDSGDVPFTHDCVLAESTTTIPDTVQGTEVARAATLPRTGSGSTLPFTTLAGLLVMTGGLLLALVNRPTPTTATARTRSRGR
ncbi:MAG: hypothetical protein QOG30_288 [Acidimicrobiaceae bacterium]|jgi:hypothetical protein